MKSFTRLYPLLAIGAALAVASNAKAVAFNYSSDPGAAISFAGNGNFSFTGNAGDIFQITSGTANGLLGDISGTYTIGAINGNSAPVTGSGQFIVHDGGNNFVANITWVDIQQSGALGGLNTLTAAVNMTGITYGGSNADLVALKNSGSAVNTVSFQFSSPKTLAQLKGPDPISNSFSGTVASVPDGGTAVVLLGLALSGLAVVRRKFSV